MTNPDVIKSLFTADCTLIVERNGHISWCDERADDLFGMRPGDFPGWDFPERVGLHFPDMTMRLRLENLPIGKILAGEPIQNIEIYVRNQHTPEEGVWLSVNAEPILSWSMDEVVAALVVCHDITARKHALRGLEDSHAALQALVQASPLPILAMERDGRVSFWNPAAESLFGWSAAEVIGGLLPFVPPGNEEESREMRREDIAGDVVRSRDIQRRRKDGSLIDLAVSRAPIRDGQGAITGTICLYVDMTERRQMEERVRQSAKMESLGILAGGIAHDFNNLLTTMLGHSSLALEDARPGSDQARALSNVIGAAERAAVLTRQMLAYAGQSIYRPEPLNLRRLIDGMLSILRAAVGREVELLVDIETNVPLIRADAEQFRHVVMNLVLNAKEAITGAGLVQIRAGGTGSPGNDLCAFLEVRDNGCGMDRETKERMFDPFFSTKFTGRGLGLAAVLGIVRAHGGEITVETTPGHGTLVRVRISATEQAASATD